MEKSGHPDAYNAEKNQQTNVDEPSPPYPGVTQLPPKTFKEKMRGNYVLRIVIMNVHCSLENTQSSSISLAKDINLFQRHFECHKRNSQLSLFLRHS